MVHTIKAEQIGKSEKTRAQEINWDFETNGVFKIRDKDGNYLYWENSNGVWQKSEFDSRGNLIYLEDSNGWWQKSEYDSQGNCIYRESSDGVIIDYRTSQCEGKVVEIDGVKYKLVKL